MGSWKVITVDIDDPAKRTYRWGETAIGDAARSDHHTVELVEGEPHGIAVEIDGVSLFEEGGYPDETFTLASDWQKELTDEAKEKVREVYQNERGDTNAER